MQVHPIIKIDRLSIKFNQSFLCTEFLSKEYGLKFNVDILIGKLHYTGVEVEPSFFGLDLFLLLANSD